MVDQMLLKHNAAVLPQNSDTRERLLGQIAEFAAARRLNPPPDYRLVETLAADFVREYGGDLTFLPFVMVALSNEIWRPFVAEIPCSRRVLVLPECLKNSEKCPASRDAFGLVCEGCGACSVASLLDSAESLGYLTVVAEGTTVVKALIEKGEADAVIGVGCMESLSKIVETVNSHALAAIAVPLLRDGCRDTEIDEEWLLRELHSTQDITGRTYHSLASLRESACALFDSAALTRIMGEARSKTEKVAREYLCAGGKRLRPALVMLSHDAFGGDAVLRRDTLALAVECFHKASLIHDDIEDDDDEREGMPTLHCRYGLSFAINVGDYLLGEGYRLIAQAAAQGGVDAAALLAAASGGHIDMTVGQGDELYGTGVRVIATVEEQLLRFSRKTSAAFRIAVLLGAISAGAGAETVANLETLSHAFGIAFQIRDDLDDACRPDGDLSSLRSSLLASIVCENLDEAGTEDFMSACEKCDSGRIAECIVRGDAIERARHMLREQIALVYDTLARIDNMLFGVILRQICARLFNEYL